MTDHQWPGSATNGRSWEPFGMAAYGSESGRWADAFHLAGFDPLRTSSNDPLPVNFFSSGS